MPLYTFLHNLLDVLVQMALQTQQFTQMLVTVHDTRNSRKSVMASAVSILGVRKNKTMLSWAIAPCCKPNPGLQNREYGRGDPMRWPRDTLSPQKLALTLPTNGGRSVGIIRSRTKAKEFGLVLFSVSRTWWERATSSFSCGHDSFCVAYYSVVLSERIGLRNKVQLSVRRSRPFV
jgi:hypothetical protein